MSVPNQDLDTPYDLLRMHWEKARKKKKQKLQRVGFLFLPDVDSPDSKTRLPEEDCSDAGSEGGESSYGSSYFGPRGPRGPVRRGILTSASLSSLEKAAKRNGVSRSEADARSASSVSDRYGSEVDSDGLVAVRGGGGRISRSPSITSSTGSGFTADTLEGFDLDEDNMPLSNSIRYL